LAIKQHWSDKCAEDECVSRDAGLQRSKKKEQYGDDVVGQGEMPLHNGRLYNECKGWGQFASHHCIIFLILYLTK
jgi:hypothetical protein